MPLIAVTRPVKPDARYHNRRKILAQELKPVARTMERSRAKVVENWQNKPSFQATVSIKPNQIEIVTVVRRAGRLKGSTMTTADLWKMIDQTGSRPHIIRPKRPTGVLAFPWGGPGSYSSKTGARPARYGGPGVTRGEVVFRKFINHPGFPPRHFTKAIDKDVEKDFRAAIERGQVKATKLGY